MKDIKIIVAAHKPYNMPTDKMYLPLQVGAYGKESIGFMRDDQGDNISDKNPCYCELTGLYFAWKNIDAEYIGLVHYRRHFSLKSKAYRNKNGVLASVLSNKETEKLLETNDMILPKKRKYYIETMYSHYEHTMYVEPLDVTKNVIAEIYPDYLPYFEKHMAETSGHMFNMFIMKNELLCSYCEWLFNVLTEVEKRVNADSYDAFHSRFFGRLSELLLDVWTQKNGITYAEVPVVSTEKVNWFKKGGAFLLAKFTGKKYGKSF